MYRRTPMSRFKKSIGSFFTKVLKKTRLKTAPPTPPTKPLPRNYKIVERYPLYEPYVHVAIAQNPKTGEFKYILDELQLDVLERNVYDRILDILLAEIGAPREELEDPRGFFWALLHTAYTLVLTLSRCIFSSSTFFSSLRSRSYISGRRVVTRVVFSHN